MDNNMSEAIPATRKKSRRRNGDGNTYRYKNGWRTVISYKGHTVTAMGRSEQESRRLAKAKLAALPKFNTNLVPGANKLSLASFLIDWLENKHKQEIAMTTYRRYESLIRVHVIPALGEIKLHEVTKHHINGLMTQMRANGQSNRSRQQTRAILSAAFNDAAEDDLVAINPVKNSRPIEVTSPQIHPFTLDEVKHLLESTQDSRMNARIRLAVIYGLRQGEALGLQWKDIDFEKGTIFLWQQVQKIGSEFKFVRLKSDASIRTLRLDKETLDSLKQHRVAQNAIRLRKGELWQDNNLLFPGALGQPSDSGTDHRQWCRALASANLPIKRLHDARHTAGTLLFDQGVDIEVIRRFLGHSSIVLTSKTYVHHSARQIEKASEVIDKMMKGA
jgi:integrase